MCGAAGHLLYANLTDQIFGTTGTWNLKQCTSPECGLIWLDPAPLEEDLGKAYKIYFTHEPAAAPASAQSLSSYQRAVQLVKSAYVSKRFGYQSDTGKPFHWILALPIYLSALHRAAMDMRYGHLLGVKRGRILDVGCGAGELLKLAKEVGWNGEGIEVDPEAVKAARGKGLTVYLGQLADRHYPDGTFDLVQMSHVIEHVDRPLELLRECHRVLGDGGLLVIWTPNTESLGHRIFSERWAGLDPPRHLNLWNSNSLRKLVMKAGFLSIQLSTNVRMTPFVVSGGWFSRVHKAIPRQISSFESRFYSCAVGVIEQLLLKRMPFAGEELILEARK
jgi:SAM-dependent methyltransferase